jgi:hypothetical protein
LAVLTTGSLAAAATASGSPRPDGTYLRPGNLLVSRSVYVNRPGTIQAGVTVLPPGCTTGCAVASSDGTYPTVFNNDLVDGSFGVTSPVFLDQLLLQVRAGPEPVHQRPGRHLHGLRRAGRRA